MIRIPKLQPYPDTPAIENYSYISPQPIMMFKELAPDILRWEAWKEWCKKQRKSHEDKKVQTKDNAGQ